MEFVEPGLWWGAAAIAIPVAIHFWHQQRAKRLPWAATRWLVEKEQQQSLGLHLDNIPLLLVRCVALLLLTLLLSQPILDGFRTEKKTQVVHLVQPNALIVNNFRFELAEAIKKGETVLWATATPTPVQELELVESALTTVNPLTLQTALHQLPPQTTQLHLYAENKRALADVPVIMIPTPFQLHLLVDSTQKPRPWLLVNGNRKLFMNKAGMLTSNVRPDPGLRLPLEPIHSGAVRVLLHYTKIAERQTVKAALAALTEVYGLAFLIDEKPLGNLPYEFVLTDKTPVRPNPSTLYFVSETERIGMGSNVVYAFETLTPQTSERVATGQLPEWLGHRLIDFFGLSTTELPLSQRELNQLFQPAKKQKPSQQANSQQFVFLLLLAVVLLERGIALPKNA